MREKLEKKLELMSFSVDFTIANSIQFEIRRIYITLHSFSYFKKRTTQNRVGIIRVNLKSST